MNDSYEKKRNNLFKLFDKEVDGVRIAGRHISYFKESSGIPVVPRVAVIPENKYEYLLPTADVRDMLRHKYRYSSRHWKNWQKELIAGVEHYISQAEQEGCGKVILCYSEYRLLFM